jgi:hypothetical protein
MSKRNMSERANCGLMLCERIRPNEPILFYPPSPEESKAEQSNLNTLNGLVPKGVSDENKFRPLTQLLQNIGESNRDGSTPMNTNNLTSGGNKLFLDFIKEAVPPTGNPEADKASVQKVLTQIQATFGLSDQQIEGLQKKLDNNKQPKEADTFQPNNSNGSNNDLKKDPWVQE